MLQALTKRRQAWIKDVAPLLKAYTEQFRSRKLWTEEHSLKMKDCFSILAVWYVIFHLCIFHQIMFFLLPNFALLRFPSPSIGIQCFDTVDGATGL